MWSTLARFRELLELSDRLTTDGRDSLAALQMELEAEEEARLAEERGDLREALSGESVRFPVVVLFLPTVRFFACRLVLRNRSLVYSSRVFRIVGTRISKTRGCVVVVVVVVAKALEAEADVLHSCCRCCSRAPTVLARLTPNVNRE